MLIIYLNLTSNNYVQFNSHISTSILVSILVVAKKCGWKLVPTLVAQLRGSRRPLPSFHASASPGGILRGPIVRSAPAWTTSCWATPGWAPHSCGGWLGAVMVAFKGCLWWSCDPAVVVKLNNLLEVQDCCGDLSQRRRRTRIFVWWGGKWYDRKKRLGEATKTMSVGSPTYYTLSRNDGYPKHSKTNKLLLRGKRKF